MLTGFEDERVPRSERGRGFHRREHQRRVPGSNGADDTVGFFLHVGVELAVLVLDWYRSPFEFRTTEVRVVAEPPTDSPGLGTHLGYRPTVLTDCQFAQLLDVVLNGVRYFPEELSPFGR